MKSNRRFNPQGPMPTKRPTLKSAASSFPASSFGVMKSDGSWVPRGRSRMTFSPIVTNKNDAIRVLLMVSKRNTPLERNTRRTSKSTPLEVLDMFKHVDTDDDVKDVVSERQTFTARDVIVDFQIVRFGVMPRCGNRRF